MVGLDVVASTIRRRSGKGGFLYQDWSVCGSVNNPEKIWLSDDNVKEPDIMRYIYRDVWRNAS